MNPITSLLVFVLALAALAAGLWVNLCLALPIFAVAAVVATSLKMANVWQKFVVLRMGKLRSVKGPGMFAINPVIDNAVAVLGRDPRRRPPSSAAGRHVAPGAGRAREAGAGDSPVGRSRDCGQIRRGRPCTQDHRLIRTTQENRL
jgi:hypothetical protein